jgi:hypothetical protein
MSNCNPPPCKISKEMRLIRLYFEQEGGRVENIRRCDARIAIRVVKLLADQVKRERREVGLLWCLTRRAEGMERMVLWREKWFHSRWLVPIIFEPYVIQ